MPVVVEDPVEARTGTAEDVGGEQRAAQVDVGEALPGVADPAVHLDGRLAHGASGPGAVGLGDAAAPAPRRVPGRRRPRRRGGRRCASPPWPRRRRPAGAAPPGTSRSGGRTAGAPRRSARRGRPPRIVPTRSAQVSGQPERGPRGEVVVGEGTALVGEPRRRAAGARRRPGQVGAPRRGRARLTSARPPAPGTSTSADGAPWASMAIAPAGGRVDHHAGHRGRATADRLGGYRAGGARRGAGGRRPASARGTGRRPGRRAPRPRGPPPRPTPSGSRPSCAARSSRQPDAATAASSFARSARRRRGWPTVAGPRRPTTCAAESRRACCSGGEADVHQRARLRRASRAPTRRGGCGAAPCPDGSPGMASTTTRWRSCL